jgi:hypothetical protein
MHPLGLLLNITFCTILATHILTDTSRTLRTDAAGAARRQKVAHPAALAGMWRNELGFEAHGRAEPTLPAAEFTGPRPPQKPESLEFAAALRRRQMTWLARPYI